MGKSLNARKLRGSSALLSVMPSGPCTALQLIYKPQDTHHHLAEEGHPSAGQMNSCS